MITGWKLLDDNERKHLKLWNCLNRNSDIEEMLKNLAIQRGDPESYSQFLKIIITPAEPCCICRSIAEKLGYLVKV